MSRVWRRSGSKCTCHDGPAHTFITMIKKRRREPRPSPPVDPADRQGPYQHPNYYAYDFSANTPDEHVMDFDSQSRQYPKSGRPGITYFRGQVTRDYHVDCLLYRNEDGELVGILNHYPEDFPPYEKKGAVNVRVRPDHQRRGIGSALIVEALERFRIQADDQRLSSTGSALARSLVERLDWGQESHAPNPVDQQENQGE